MNASAAPLAQAAGRAVVWKAAQFGLARLISLFRVFILARLLAPDDFGLLAVAVVAVDAALRLTDVGVTPALVQGAVDDPRQLNVAWTVLLARGAATAVVLAVAAPLVTELFAEPRATNLVQVLALRPLIDALSSVRLAELTRALRFRALAAIQVPAALVEAGVAIALAGRIGVWAVVVGTLSGALAVVAASYVVAPHRPRLAFDAAFAATLVRYGRWIFLGSVFEVATGGALQAVISRRLGATELGLYFMASRLALLPYEVAGGVVGAVAFPLYARLQHELSRAARAFRAVLVAMAGLLIPTYALIFALAPQLVLQLLGPAWANSVTVVRVFAVLGVVGLFGDAVVPLLQGLGHPARGAAIGAVRSALVLTLAWKFTGWGGVVGAASAWLPATVISLAMGAHFVRRLLPSPLAGLERPALAIALASGVGGGAANAAATALPGLAGLIVAGVLGVMAGAATLWGLDRALSLHLRALTAPILAVLRPRSTLPSAL